LQDCTRNGVTKVPLQLRPKPALLVGPWLRRKVPEVGLADKFNPADSLLKATRTENQGNPIKDSGVPLGGPR
jgi:hypothetical protein